MKTMTHNKYKNIRGETRVYMFRHKEITSDDFFRLEKVAELENEMMKHKIFFVFKLDGVNKVFTGLN
jgi:hypothetical protein